MSDRSVTRVLEGQSTIDGAGVRLSRTLGSAALDHHDPFLLLDEFRSDDASDYIAGFPDHPHRGFETVTYMLAGSMLHRDHKGNEGRLVAGSVQWMTAGRGIVHSEMPQQEDGLLWGFQLWINLPAARKLTDPHYQDIPPDRIPEAALPGGGRARVVAGEAFGARGPVQGIATAPLYLDVTVPAAGLARLPVPAGHNAFVYVFEGRLDVGAPPQNVARGHLAILGDGDRLILASSEGGRALVVAARPIGEPIVRRGPFVMNTDREILDAIRDYQTGRLQA